MPEGKIIGIINLKLDFPGGSEYKASVYNGGDPGSIPGSGKSPGEGNVNPLQFPWLENSMDEGACWATIHVVANCLTPIIDFLSFML